MRGRGVAATITLLAGAIAVAWACVVALSGGFALGRLVSRDPIRPLILGAILASIARVLSPADFDATLKRIAGTRDRWPARIAALASAAMFVVATAWNTRAAGGSDSSCYVLQADAFAHGHLVLRHPLAGTVPHAVPAMFAPTGFIASPRDPFDAVPICAPGLALAMAAVRPFGKSAVFIVVPLCAALAIWITFAFARRASDDVTGAAAACLLACSPIFLYQAVQPMSDVPATLFWLAALTSLARGGGAGQIGGGVWASLAVLTRPNLAPAVVPFVWLLPDRRAWIRWIAGAAPAIAVLAALNAVRYGSPLATGYGSAGELFSTGHLAANLSRYVRWFVETQTPIGALALAAPWAVRGDRARVRLAIVALVSAALVAAPYLAYTVFDDWWYLRFLLPILPIVLVYAVAVVLRAIPGPFRGAAAVVFASVLGVWYLHVAATRHVFELQRLESRFVLTGAYAARELPADAVVLAVEQSGSIRFYAGRPTIAWDGVPPDGLDALVYRLRATGHSVFAALEDAETQSFRDRFSAQVCGAVAERPVGEIFAAVRVRIYSLSCALPRRYVGVRLTSRGGGSYS